jgi:hypothetical protein
MQMNADKMLRKKSIDKHRLDKSTDKEIQQQTSKALKKIRLDNDETTYG